MPGHWTLTINPFRVLCLPESHLLLSLLLLLLVCVVLVVEKYPLLCHSFPSSPLVVLLQSPFSSLWPKCQEESKHPPETSVSFQQVYPPIPNGHCSEGLRSAVAILYCCVSPSSVLTRLSKVHCGGIGKAVTWDSGAEILWPQLMLHKGCSHLAPWRTGALDVVLPSSLSSLFLLE